MRKLSTRVLALLAALIIAIPLCFALSSCDNGNPADTTAAENQDTTAADTEPAADENALELIVNGKANVKVIRPDADSTDAPSVVAAKAVRTALLNYSKSVEITTDWTKDGKHSAETIEILVGLTNYEETTKGYDNLKYGDYRVTVSGNKIVLAGYSEKSLKKAATVLANIFKEAAVKAEDETYTLKVEKSALEATGTSDKTLSSFPLLTGATMSSYYDPGDSCDELVFTKATKESFDQNITLLKESGYKLYTQREVNGSCFATLYNEKYTLNFGFYKGDKALRLIMEPYDAKTLIGLEPEKYEVVTTSQITMLGVEYKDSDGGMVGNGMSILIRIADGRFIVVDGGFNRQATANVLLNAMKEQSADYIAKTKTITVAAWIITHSHGDHNGMINGKTATFKNAGVKVERFLINFMSDDERTKSMSTYTDNWSNGEGGGWGNTYSAAYALGADICVAHVGQIYYFADLAIDVLYTIESHAPTTANALNATSLIMKMSFTDPATKKVSTYLSTGDATGAGFRSALNTFGNHLKCDIVQVAHHGYSTWGNSDQTMLAYKTALPECVLWPQGSKANPNYVTKDYNAVLINTSTNPNFKEKYVAGLEGTQTIVPMPYVVGNVKVIAP